MKHLKLTFLLTVLMSMVGAKAFAHDIEVKNAYGVTIYYTWTNKNTELAVSYRGSDFDEYSNDYSGNVVIPASVTYNGKTFSVTSIGDGAFVDCTGLTSITIPNSVTSIGWLAFYGCSGLTSVTIPNSVTSIGESAFSSCYSLTSITIPNSVTSIGDHAFDGCIGLTSVTIPNSVTSIGSSAFSGCESLTSVTIPNSVTYIGEYAFEGCTGLTSVTIPNSVTSIGSDAFDGCIGLTSVTIPNSVTSIGMYAFYNCSGLTSITIPNSVTTIGDWAFGICSHLTSITSFIQEPFATTSNCWYIVPKSIPLYVPYGTKEKYQNTDGWKEFTNIIEMDETTGINSLTSDSSAKGEESGNIYSLDGRKVSNSGLSKGIYIKNGKKVVIK